MQGEVTTTNQSSSTPASSLLVVDDNSMNRSMLSRYITRLGYRATLAENGRTEELRNKARGEPGGWNAREFGQKARQSRMKRGV